MQDKDKPLKELVALFLKELEAKGKNQRTLYTYGKDLEQVMQFFGEDKPIGNILTPQIGKFFQSDILLKKPGGKDRASQTVNKTIRVFRMFMVWAYEHQYIKSVPLPKNTPMGRSQI